MAEPGHTPRQFVFVLMPLSKAFTDVFETSIKRACELAGVYCEHVGHQRFDERILDRIYNQIVLADVIVAEMTGCNPNVFYEVGYAHALQKRVILLTQRVEDIPFDLRHHRHIVYDGQLHILRDLLADELRWCIRTPVEPVDSWSPRSGVRRITKILAAVSKAVAGKLKVQPLLATIIEEMTEILDAEVCSIFLEDPDDPDVIKCVAGSGFAEAIVDIAEYHSGEGFTGKVFQRGQTAIIGPTAELEELRRRNDFQGKYDAVQWAAFGGRSQFRNGIASPLKIGDSTIGVIKIENKRRGEFTAADVAIVEAITNGVVSVAIQNARLLIPRLEPTF
jgi:hypothetical protein